MSSTETFWNPSAVRMPVQTAWRIGSSSVVPVSRADDREDVLERRAVPRGLREVQRVLDGLGGVGGEGGEHPQLLVGGSPSGRGLVDREEAQQTAQVVAQGDEERVLGVPRLRVVDGLELRDVARRLVLGPVELVPGQEEAAVALEGRVQQRRPLLQRPARAQQRVTGVVGAVDGRDQEVVEGGPVERDDDGAEPHRVRDRRGHRREQAVEVVALAHEATGLQEAGEARDGRGAVVRRPRRPRVLVRPRRHAVCIGSPAVDLKRRGDFRPVG